MEFNDRFGAALSLWPKSEIDTDAHERAACDTGLSILFRRGSQRACYDSAVRTWITAIGLVVATAASACGTEHTSQPGNDATVDAGTGGTSSQGGGTATGGTTSTGGVGAWPIAFDPSCPDVDYGTSGVNRYFGFTMSGCCLPSGECGAAYAQQGLLRLAPGCYPYSVTYPTYIPYQIYFSLPPTAQVCGIRDGGIDASTDASADGGPEDARSDADASPADSALGD